MDLTKYHYYTNEQGKLVSVDLSTGEEAIADSSDCDLVSNKFAYNKRVAIQICEKVREGFSLADIGNMPDMPPASTIYRWARAIEDFAIQLEYAREDRAHYYHDQVLKEAAELNEPSMVNVVKTKIDAYKWAAEKANKRYYGKEKDGEDKPTNVSIIISTGIPDAPQPVTVEASCKNLAD